jgi:hypothetical protein
MRVEAQKNAQLAVSLACRISLVAAVVLITSSDLLHHLPRSSTLFYLGLLVAFDLAASVAYHVCSKAVHAQRSLPDEEMRRLPDVEGEVCKRQADICSGQPCVSFTLDERDVDTMKSLPPLKIRTPQWQREQIPAGCCPSPGPERAEVDILDLLMQETVRSLVDC